jgi:hypothetical protein
VCQSAPFLAFDHKDDSDRRVHLDRPDHRRDADYKDAARARRWDAADAWVGRVAGRQDVGRLNHCRELCQGWVHDFRPWALDAEAVVGEAHPELHRDERPAVDLVAADEAASDGHRLALEHRAAEDARSVGRDAAVVTERGAAALQVGLDCAQEEQRAQQVLQRLARQDFELPEQLEAREL